MQRPLDSCYLHLVLVNDVYFMQDDTQQFRFLVP
jgi:hypothetical protein